ncbi:MAG: ABC transporter ATP-binding protein [Armatimonadota bacterium]|nr:ABC transporter ATP-binding protein [Armatimonadota bacterium]
MSSGSILQVEGVHQRFGGLLALQDVSLSVEEGEILGLIGPNGAGKTTLFNVISGYLRPTEGSVRFLGKEVTGLPPYRLAAMGMGRTFQIVRPFPKLTVLENVLIGSFLRTSSRREAEDRAWETLHLTGLAPFASRPAASLNLAGRKRLEIARALALNPRLLLLDEVVAGLNPAETDATVKLIRRVRDRGITIIVVEHVMRVIMGLSDRVVVLNYGRKIAEGKPQEVASDPAVIAAYLGESGGGSEGR